MLVKYNTEGPSYLMRELQERKIHGTIQFFFFFFNVYLAALSFRYGMRDLVPSPAIEPRAPALGVSSFSQWTTRKAPATSIFFNIYRYNSLPGYIIQVL